MWLGKLRSPNPLRIPHPKIDKLACQAEGGGILAEGEITFRDADCNIFHLIFAKNDFCAPSGGIVSHFSVVVKRVCDIWRGTGSR